MLTFFFWCDNHYFESRGVDEEQILKDSVEVELGRYAVVMWKWTNKVGGGIRGEFKRSQTLRAEARLLKK
jgi:hypothetical protein